MEMCPLGPLQETLLLHALSTGGLGATLQQHVIRFAGMHAYDHLLAACRVVVGEQPNLRGKLVSSDDIYGIEPVDTAMVAFKTHDLGRLDSASREKHLYDFLHDDKNRGFPEEAALCRFALIQYSQSSAVLVWTVSSLVVDRSSIGIVLGRILECWNGSPVKLMDQGEAWEMICQWNIQHAGSDDEKMEKYWRAYLNGVEPSNWLPPTVTGGERSKTFDNSLSLELGMEASTRLKAFAQEQGLDWVNMAEVTWALLAQRFGGDSDLLFAVERDFRSECHKSVAGVFSNLLLRRFVIPRQTEMTAWLHEEHSREPELDTHGTCSLSRVMHWAGLSRDGSWLTALVRVENPSIGDSLGPFRSHFEFQFETRYEAPGVPVVATMTVSDPIKLAIVVDSGKVDTVLALQLLTCWRRLLEQLADKPSSAISDLKALSDDESALVLQKWNQTDVPYSSDSCVHHLFSKQAAATPDWISVSMGSESLSYRELDTLSDGVAELLYAKGVRTDSCVAICLPRSLMLPVALMGVLKAGGAYVPIDPSYPPERIALMIEDSNARVVITQGEIENRIRMGKASILLLESIGDLPKYSSGFEPPEAASPDQLAYVIYTSGSTGRPKGVAMIHRAMVNLIEWQIRISSGLPPRARTLQFSALSFDVSFQEMLSTLCSGGQLVLITEEIRHNPSALWQCIHENKINRIFLPFVALQQLAEAAVEQEVLPDCLLEVITAGEQLQISPQVTQLFKRTPRASLHNQYGPSETHVVTSLTLEGNPSNWPFLPTIGRPIANTRAYILNDSLNPVPVGGIGEIYIGGVALARGYLNRPEMTAEQFLPDPFRDRPDARLYRTGDLGRHRPDSSIEFLGRADDQVKIRGFRVELAEVEAALRQEPSIRDCVVNAWRHQGENRLVAYVLASSREIFDEGRVRDQVQSRIPDYMCPGFYIQVERLPMTPSGKVNRRALPEPVLERAAFQVGFEPPRNKMEETIIRIWQEVLGINSIGRKDRFFDLGGTSLLIIRVHRKLEGTIARKFPVTTLFKHSTVASLAAHIDEPDSMDQSRRNELRGRAERQRRAMTRQPAMRLHHRRRDI